MVNKHPVAAQFDELTDRHTILTLQLGYTVELDDLLSFPAYVLSLEHHHSWCSDMQTAKPLSVERRF